MTIKDHEKEYYHIDKSVVQRIIVTLIGLAILASSMMSVITLTALVEPQAREHCYEELWARYYQEGSTHIAVPSNELRTCKANYLPLACPWFIIVFAISLIVGLMITAIGVIGWDNIW